MSLTLLGEHQLDNGSLMNNNFIFIMYYPSLKKTRDLIIPIEFHFYVDVKAYLNKKSRIFPLNKDNKAIYGYTQNITVEDMNDPEGLTNQKIAYKITRFLEENYGYWNVIDNEYWKLENYDIEINDISESTSGEAVTELPFMTDINYRLDNIKCSCECQIKTENEIIYSDNKLLNSNFDTEQKLYLVTNGVSDNVFISIKKEIK